VKNGQRHKDGVSLYAVTRSPYRDESKSLQQCTPYRKGERQGTARLWFRSPDLLPSGCTHRPYCCASRARNNLRIENTQFLYVFCARPEPYDCLEQCWSCGCCSSCSCLYNYPYLRLWWATTAAFRRLPFCFAALVSALPSFRLLSGMFQLLLHYYRQ